MSYFFTLVNCILKLLDLVPRLLSAGQSRDTIHNVHGDLSFYLVHGLIHFEVFVHDHTRIKDSSFEGIS